MEQMRFKISSALKDLIGKDLITNDNVAIFDFVAVLELFVVFVVVDVVFSAFTMFGKIVTIINISAIASIFLCVFFFIFIPSSFVFCLIISFYFFKSQQI